jgi:5-methylcytosine-specific restriction endonuclease McrA
MTNRTCSHGDCRKPHVARGYCGMHYQRWSKGLPLDAPADKRSLEGLPHALSPDGLCVVPECLQPVRVKRYGWCGMHHARWLKTGDLQEYRPCRDDRREDGCLWCSSCEAHRAQDDFYRNRTTKTGRDGICKQCTQGRRERDRDHRRSVMRAYRTQNRERINASKRVAYRLDPGKSNEAGRAWRKANPERVRLQIRAQNLARYAKAKGAPGRATPRQIVARWDYYGGRCWMCGAPATDTDHVKPLDKGGSNWPANLRPACRKCNRAKGARWPFPLEVARASSSPRREAA